MKYLHSLFAVASAAFFIASAQAQNAGTVTNHAFVLGKGAGTTGYTSLLCGSAQLAVGQAAADPICQTITGDVTITSGGVTAIGASKVANSQLATMAANTTKCNATAGTTNPTDCTASTMRTNLGVVIGTNVEAWDADLDALAGISASGILARTGAGTAAARTITGTANQITVTNGDGVAGNPTLSVPTSFFANPSASIGLTVNNGSAATAMRSDGTPALSQAIVPTWAGTHTFSNATYSALFSGGPIGVGNAAPTVPLHVGSVAAASSSANILSARASTGATSVHGFAENSTINLSAPGQGMDSYDARMVVSGTQTYDHFVSYQSRPQYGSSGISTWGYDFWGQAGITGPVTSFAGHYAAAPAVSGGGSIANLYGFYAEAMTSGGTLNYAFFSAGTTPSKFGGNVDVGSLSVAGTDATGSWSSYTPTLSAGSGALGTGNSSSGRYKQIGKTVCFSAQANLGASGAGTAATYLILGLPVAAKQTSNPGITFSGIRSGLVGLTSIIDTTTTIDVIDAASGANPIANSRTYYITGCYEAA